MLDAGEDLADTVEIASTRQNLRRAAVAEQRQRCCQPVGSLLFVSENRHGMGHDGYDTIDADNRTFGRAPLSRHSFHRRVSARKRLAAQFRKPNLRSGLEQSKLRLRKAHHGADPILRLLIQIEADEDLTIPRGESV